MNEFPPRTGAILILLSFIFISYFTYLFIFRLRLLTNSRGSQKRLRILLTLQMLEGAAAGPENCRR